MIATGTKIGSVTATDGTEVTISYGVTALVGLLKLIPTWDDHPPAVLCLVPPGAIVTKDGQRQSGAFLVTAGKCFEYAGEKYTFVATSQMTVTTTDGGVCAFCKSQLTVTAVLWLVENTPLYRSYLCTACARAFSTAYKG